MSLKKVCKMSFVKSYKKYLIKAAMVWAVCCVVFLAVYIIILGPQKNSRKRIENELAEKKLAYESALKAAKEETKIQLNNQIENLRNRLKDFVVDFEDSANLTFKISQIANKKDVASFSIKGKENTVRSAQPACKYINENQIVISFIGGFNQFATFLSDLERHRPVLLVDKFTMTPSGQDESVFRVSLNIAAFVRKQQETKTSDKNSTQIYGAKI